MRNSEREPGSLKIYPSRTVTAYPRNDRTPILLISFFYIDRNEYQVVGTDFTNWAVVRSCTNYVFGIFREEVYWILLRTPDDPGNPALIAQAKNLIKSRAPHYDLNNLQATYQGSECPYLT